MAVVLHKSNFRLPNEDPDNMACWGYTVYVQDLAPNITLEDLVEMGSCVGPVLEVRFFVVKQRAHIRFSRIEHAIRFMELTNKVPMKTGRYNNEFKPLMSPSWDYPCLAVRNLPAATTKRELYLSITAQFPKTEVMDICFIRQRYGVVEFVSQPVANDLLALHEKTPLRVRGKIVHLDWEGSPAFRVDKPKEFKDKKKLEDIFDVVGGEHFLGVAMLPDRAFVYYDTRSSKVAAWQHIQSPLKITGEDGTKYELPVMFL